MILTCSCLFLCSPNTWTAMWRNIIPCNNGICLFPVKQPLFELIHVVCHALCWKSYSPLHCENICFSLKFLNIRKLPKWLIPGQRHLRRKTETVSRNPACKNLNARRKSNLRSGNVFLKLSKCKVSSILSTLYFGNKCEGLHGQVEFLFCRIGHGTTKVEVVSAGLF